MRTAGKKPAQSNVSLTEGLETGKWEGDLLIVLCLVVMVLSGTVQYYGKDDPPSPLPASLRIPPAIKQSQASKCRGKTRSVRSRPFRMMRPLHVR